MTLSIPVISTVTAAIFLDESVAPAQVVGMAIVLLALGAAIRVSSAPAVPQPEATGATGPGRVSPPAPAPPG
jgi:hypothetical protein